MKRGRVELALARALRAAPLTGADAAAVELAKEYAKGIDGGHLIQVGRSFAEILAELGMTPKSRAALLKTAPAPAPAAGLDELRQRREQRA